MKISYLMFIASLNLVGSTNCFANMERVDSLLKSICPSIANLASSLMEARQNNWSNDQVKDIVKLGMKLSPSINDEIFQKHLIPNLEKLANETQYFPILKNKSDQKTLIDAYETFVLNRCNDGLNSLAKK